MSFYIFNESFINIHRKKNIFVSLLFAVIKYKQNLKFKYLFKSNLNVIQAWKVQLLFSLIEHKKSLEKLS